MITQKYLKELLHYDSRTGIFTWLVSKNKNGNVCAGNVAGNLDSRGYFRIGIDNNRYKSHRLAWLYVYGKLPNDQIDHINRIRHDNRIVNLRETTNSGNHQNRKLQSNNSSGFSGVIWDKTNRKWVARIWLRGKQISLGYYHDKNEACMARLKAKVKYHSFDHGDASSV